jgi:hypothetical protein
MHNFGLMAKKNDVFTRMFLGAINGVLRSKLGSMCLLIAMLFLSGGLLWDATLDLYVVHHGKRVVAPVVEEYACREGGYTTRYRYPGASSGNPLHIFQSLWIDSRGASDIGVANTMGTSTCQRALGTVTVAYLPDSPRVHAVVGDRTGFLFFLIGTVCLGASMGLMWNLKRLGRDEPALALPGWPEPCHG